MGCYLRFFLLGFCLCLLSTLVSQTSGVEDQLTDYLNGGVFEQPTSGKRLLVQVGEPQAEKAQDEKAREVNKNGHKQDAIVASLETGAAVVQKLPTGPADDKEDTIPGNEETHSASGLVPEPSVDKKDETSVAGNKTQGEKEFDGHLRDNDTILEPDSQKAVQGCGGSHCKDPTKQISACLSIPGDRPHKFSLFITYEGDTNVLVKVIAPKFLRADPLQVLVSKGKSETVHLSMDSNYELDSEAMQNKTIVVTSVSGKCEIQVPMEYLRDEKAPMLPSVDPRVIACLLVFGLIVLCVGAWLCYKCRGKKRSGDVKYQQLEMNGAGNSTPKAREKEAIDGWDEVWDDDWEDTEAAKSSSRLSQSLSSRGFAARRGTKDGWDNSWED